MSKINLNLIDRPALFEMAKYIRVVKDGRANEPRINGPLYFLISFIFFLTYRIILPMGLLSNYGPVVIISFLIFVCIICLSFQLDFRRLNDIGVEKDLRNALVIINGFVTLFSSLFFIFYKSTVTDNSEDTILFHFIYICIMYGLFMGLFLIYTPTDNSYVKRICKGFYSDSQIAEAYKYVMNERKNILAFKDSKDASDSYSDELRKVKKLYDEGILTEEEFKKAKKKILDI